MGDWSVELVVVLGVGASLGLTDPVAEFVPGMYRRRWRRVDGSGDVVEP